MLIPVTLASIDSLSLDREKKYQYLLRILENIVYINPKMSKIQESQKVFINGDNGGGGGGVLIVLFGSK